MSLNDIPLGKNPPEDIYGIIEIPANSNYVKYEIDKINNAIFVDRFINAAMFYPCNYGYVNNTISLDGDPMDILVPTPYPLISGSVIYCRPVGLLNMIDESGEDEKLLAVPHHKISNEYNHIKDIDDLPSILLDKIIHFFKHYKDIESNKWVKILGWSNVELAKIEIMKSFERYCNNKKIDNII